MKLRTTKTNTIRQTSSKRTLTILHTRSYLSNNNITFCKISIATFTNINQWFIYFLLNISIIAYR